MDKYTLETNNYGQVDCRYSIPNGWIETTLNKSQLKKLDIPYYEGFFGFKKSYRYYTPIPGKIIPKDFEKIALDYLKSIKEKKDSINLIPLTVPLIAECIYSINKEAKRQRDIKCKHAENVYSSYDYEDEYDYDFSDRVFNKSQEHYLIKMAKYRENELYILKDKAISRLISENGFEPVGYHRFDNRKRDFYVIEGFCFHVNDNKSQNDLGFIENQIASERKRSIPPAKAKKILERYISQDVDKQVV